MRSVKIAFVLFTIAWVFLVMVIHGVSAEGLDIHGRTLSNTAASSACVGTSFNITTTLNITAVQRYSTSGAPNWYLYNGTHTPSGTGICGSTNLIESGTWSGGQTRASTTNRVYANGTYTFLTNGTSFTMNYGASSDLPVTGNSTYFKYYLGYSDTLAPDNYIRNVGGIYFDFAPSVTNGTIIVNVFFINDNGGRANISNITLYINSTIVANASSTSKPNGTWQVNETPLPGYALTYSGDCDSTGIITLTAGSTKTCNLTNNDLPGRLIVQKFVVNDDGGALTASSFPLFLNSSTQVYNNISTTVNASDYLVTESGTTQYALTYSGNCTSAGIIHVGNNETQYCILTNDDVRTYLYFDPTLVLMFVCFFFLVVSLWSGIPALFVLTCLVWISTSLYLYSSDTFLSLIFGLVGFVMGVFGWERGKK